MLYLAHIIDVSTAVGDRLPRLLTGAHETTGG